MQSSILPTTLSIEAVLRNSNEKQREEIRLRGVYGWQSGRKPKLSVIQNFQGSGNENVVVL